MEARLKTDPLRIDTEVEVALNVAEVKAVMSAVRLGYENEAKTKPTSTLRLLTSYITGLTRLTR